MTRNDEVQKLVEALSAPGGAHVFPLLLDNKMSEPLVGDTCIVCGIKNPTGSCTGRGTP